MYFAKADLELAAFCDLEVGADQTCTNCQSDHILGKLRPLAIAILGINGVLHYGFENM